MAKIKCDCGNTWFVPTGQLTINTPVLQLVFCKKCSKRRWVPYAGGRRIFIADPIEVDDGK